MSNIGFVYLPFTSPCMPPLGIPMLSAFLSQHGIKSKSYDLNVQLYNVLLEQDVLNKGYTYLSNIISEQLSKNTQDVHSDVAFSNLLSLKIREERNKNEFSNALDTFRRKKILTSYRDLYRYSDIIYTSLQVATLNLSYFNNNPMNYFINLEYNQIELIERDASWNSILTWFHRNLDNICAENTIISFSLCYVAQIHFFLLATQYIREKYPDKEVLVGGPLATGILKGGDINIDKDFFKKYSHLLDVVIVEDGEYPLLDYLYGRNNPRIITYPFNQYNSCAEDNRTSPLITPEYECLPLEMYLTPELTLPMITARHCYWGRCYFCSHSIGYNHFTNYDSELVISCLDEIVKKYKVSSFYFVDECTTPGTAKKIANWVIKNQNNVKWMAEMRFEPILTDIEYTQILYAGGCRYLAFGFESINDRVLCAMNKGVSRNNIEKIIDNCAESGIYINLMFFFGFPTETIDEARETFDFVINNAIKISGIGIGAFTLTPQSYVYKHYQDFGITKVLPNGNFVATKGLNQEQAQTFLYQCKRYIKEQYYRGHPFYHRTFYLIDIHQDDKALYPLGFTSKDELKKRHFELHYSKTEQYVYNDSLLELVLSNINNTSIVLLLNDDLPFNELLTMPLSELSKLKAMIPKMIKEMRRETLGLLIEDQLVIVNSI